MNSLKQIMKVLAILLVLTLAAFGSAMGQSLEEITAITFTKQTRGLLDEVVISRDSVEGFVENHLSQNCIIASSKGCRSGCGFSSSKL